MHGQESAMNELQVENPELAGKAERSRAASRAYTLQKGRAKGTWPSARPFPHTPEGAEVGSPGLAVARDHALLPSRDGRFVARARRACLRASARKAWQRLASLQLRLSAL